MGTTVNTVHTRQTLQNDILMRSIKIFDIGYINILYVGLSLLVAMLTDKIMGKFDPEKEKKKNKYQLFFEFCLTLWIYGVIIYIARNVIELVPFPLDGYQGYDHKKVKELGSAMAFIFTYVLFSDYIKQKLAYYYKDLMKE